jgi:hypothetical protein
VCVMSLPGVDLVGGINIGSRHDSKRINRAIKVIQLRFDTVVPISEVMPSRGVRALEGEGRGLSHLEVIARGVVTPASQ